MLRLPVLSTWYIWGNFTYMSLHLAYPHRIIHFPPHMHFSFRHFEDSHLQIANQQILLYNFEVCDEVLQECGSLYTNLLVLWESCCRCKSTNSGRVCEVAVTDGPCSTWFRSHQGIPPGCRHSSLGYYIAQLQGSELWLGGFSGWEVVFEIEDFQKMISYV